jgi:hypothetical protein
MFSPVEMLPVFTAIVVKVNEFQVQPREVEKITQNAARVVQVTWGSRREGGDLLSLERWNAPPDPSPPKTPPCNPSLEPFLPPPTRSNSNSPQIPLSTISLSPLLLIQEVSFLLLHPQLTESPCILLCFLTSYYHRGARQIQRQDLFISFFL